jgi:DNA-binding transcriptional MerR regulator
MEGSTNGHAEDTGRQRAGGRAGKSAAAFRTISEVAGELDVAQHVLRFWESKFPQVRPLKRGGGRRYYRPEDVDMLRQIRSLLYEEGYTIKGAQKLLRGQRRPLGDDGAEAPAERAALARPRGDDVAGAEHGGHELVPEVRARLLELREELVAVREALREAAD